MSMIWRYASRKCFGPSGQFGSPNAVAPPPSKRPPHGMRRLHLLVVDELDRDVGVARGVGVATERVVLRARGDRGIRERTG
jgi:hypothetical protein